MLRFRKAGQQSRCRRGLAVAYTMVRDVSATRVASPILDEFLTHIVLTS